MVGKDTNGNFTNNSVEFNGQPFCKEHAIDREAQLAQQKEVAVCWQRGLRVLALYLTTGRITPSN